MVITGDFQQNVDACEVDLEVIKFQRRRVAREFFDELFFYNSKVAGKGTLGAVYFAGFPEVFLGGLGNMLVNRGRENSRVEELTSFSDLDSL